MAATPETIRPEALPQIQERHDEFPETIQQVAGGIKVVPKTFTSQTNDDKGQPLIQTPPTQVVSVQPPYDQTALIAQAKGSVSSSLTWLSTFWIRVVKKAMHFGWKIISPTSQS